MIRCAYLWVVINASNSGIFIILGVLAVVLTWFYLRRRFGKDKKQEDEEKRAALARAALLADAGGSEPSPEDEAPAAGEPVPGILELMDTDEKTAAVLMAIVSERAGIPPERLRFICIKKLEDEGP